MTFEPGARTAWHGHALGQTLIVTAGWGRVQRWGGPYDANTSSLGIILAPSVQHGHSH